MAAIYVIKLDGTLSHTLKGDTQTLLLNIPKDMSYTLVEPENMFEQKFDIEKSEWVYLDQ